MELPVETRPEPMVHLVKRTAIALRDLAERHLEMAKVEIEKDTRGITTDVGLLAGAVFMLSVGYLVVTVGLAVALGNLIGMAGGFLVVGGANLLFAGAAAFIGARRLKGRHFLDDTRAQLASSAQQLAASFGGEAPSFTENHDA